MKRIISAFIALVLGLNACWSDVTPMSHHTGIKNRLRELRARLAVAHLSERHNILEDITKTERWLKDQESLLGLEPAKKLARPKVLQPNMSYPWLPDLPQSVAAELEDIPAQKTYVFNFGRSQREMRQLKNKETESVGALDAFSLGETDQGHGSLQDRRYSNYKPYPAEVCETPAEDLAKVPMVISTNALNIPVPYHYRDGAWWLHEKQGKRPWIKRSIGSGDHNIKLTELAQGPFMYTFTRPEHRPGIGKPHYHFWLDTQPPRITTWTSEKKAGGLCKLSWETQDPPLGELTVTVTVYKDDQSILSTLGGLEPKGVTLLPAHLFATAARAEVTAQDQAGNLSKREIVF